MNSDRSRARLVHALAALAMLLLGAPAARAQQPAVPGSIVGIVVDSETMRPLASVRVILQPSPAGILLERGDNPVPFGKEARVVTTDSAGVYRLGALQAGSYRLHARALGYRSVTVDLRVSESHDSQLSIGMSVQPIRLEPVVAKAAAVHADRSFAGTEAADPEDTGRVLAERARQERFLTGDTRSLTRADVQEALTLGEADLFRALQRVPGVGTRDDYTAEMWVRGASWDQTAVFFDGVPLFNPLHGAGLFSAVNTDAVGAAFLHAGVQPTELRSGGAAVVALRSRAGGASGHRGAVELSLVSGRTVADGRTRDGRVGWMVAGRRTYADLLPAGVSAALGAGVDRIPYAFHDVAGRVDAHLGRGTRIEASGIHEADRLSGDIGELVTATDARWGSNAGQVSLHNTFRGGTLRHSVGASRFAARADAREPFPTICPPPCAGYYPTLGPFRGQPLDNSVAYAFASGTWESAGEPDSVRWAVGYRAVRQEARYGTTGLWPYRSAGREGARADRDLAYLVLWGERAWHPSPRIALES
ncbi:MAG: TonB-dependent receptor, partial [Gemmatimonadetes bacterium]|nr:TonB-dependent receptor [Gemmatimonadota bacterium]